MGAVVIEPAQPNGLAVLVLMEAFGVNDHIRSLCERWSQLGYVAVAPDLYHRQGRFIVGDYGDPATIMQHFASLDTAGMAVDIGAAFDHAVAAIHGASSDVAVVGYCLGGYGAVLAACRLQPRAVAGFYGAGLSIRREGSPLETLREEFGSIGCPVHLFYGADDPVIPPAEVEATSAALGEHAVPHSVTVYEGAGHGFFCDARASYVAAAATDAWQQVVAAFETGDAR